MLKFLQFLNKSLTEQLQLPNEIFQDLSFEINTRKSSKTTTVITVRSANRDDDRDEVLRRLTQAGIQAALNTNIVSSVAPIDGSYEDNKFRIEVKPLAGGMQETTLNSSITELFPCIAFESNYTPSSVEDFMKFLMSVNVDQMNCIHSKDKKAAAETINKAESSSKYAEKMGNAMAIHQYLMDEHNTKPISNVYWGYRSSSKPRGVPKNHPGDMFIKYNDGTFLGVSLKAGGKKTKEPLLNTFVGPVFTYFNETRKLGTLRQLAYAQVYSKIEGMPSLDTFDGGTSGRHRDKTTTQKILVAYDKKNNRGYEADYDAMLEIMRTGIIDLFNSSKSKSLEYIKEMILRDAPEVPTIVIKAAGQTYSEVTDTNELGVFLPKVTFIKAYKSTKSKQNWILELKAGTEIVKMLMTIRSNKGGNAGQKKLGQFPTKLAVKYNGITR